MERWVDEIEDWDSRRASDGYAGLHALADEGFSGAASAGGTWAFLVNGRVVGVYQHRQTAAGSEISPADIERFEDAAITAYEAPHPALPLLIAMQASDGETRGRYYTGNTPLSEVHETLSGGFTGYVELSENVLSGDYYTVYQGGRASHLAFIGNAKRLLTDEEAQERAEDEVGIYEVVAVDIEVTELPEVDDEESDTAAVVGGGIDESTEDPTEDDPEESTTAEPEDTEESDEAAVSGEPATEDEREGRSTPEEAAEELTEPESEPEPESEDAADDEPAPEPATEPAAADDTDATDEPRDEQPEPESAVTAVEESDSQAATGDSHTATAASSPVDAATAASALATHTIPSLDPERSGTGDGGSASAATASRTVDGRSSSPDSSSGTEEPAASAELEELRNELERTRSEAESAQAALSEAEADLESTREELQQVRAERDELAQRVEELETQLARLEEAGAAIATEGPALSRAEALAGTNLFIRYESKGKATLEKAHDGESDAEALAENLSLEHHTQFEDEGATVEGRPFDEWLAESQEFQFARWLVTKLLFEIRETRSVEGMRGLYDALPRIDRIQFAGSVTFRDEEEGEREVRYDCVARDKMGEPLVVANLEAGRDPVTESAMASLVTDTEAVVTAEPTVASGMLVTASFFDPAALETAQQATSGSLLSRDKRRSFVKLSRKRGFHLCLVESRDETFHLSIPDL
ncbi:DUF7527 domain-containing protein [Natronomonas sp. EA1]|uniref:DUF7527 domain-containing protein n=1 Tax=Natronomonas sp. EA1 TaxID=3421655 RepID=UPI003EBEF817